MLFNLGVVKNYDRRDKTKNGRGKVYGMYNHVLPRVLYYVILSLLRLEILEVRYDKIH